MTHDKAFVADARKQRLDVRRARGRRSKLIRATVDTDPAVVKLTKQLTSGK